MLAIIRIIHGLIVGLINPLMYNHVLIYSGSKLEISVLFYLFSKLGVNVDLMTQQNLKDKFPWMKVDDIALGSYGK
jgi:hypothetical protein